MTVWQKTGFGATLVLGVLVQTTWGHAWSVAGCFPDLYLVLSICAGLTLGPRRGTEMGLALGYVEGAMIGQSVGSFMISRGMVAFLTGLAEARLYRDNLWVPVLCVFAGTIVGELLFLVMSPNFPFASWTMTIIKEAPYNACFAIFFFPPLACFTRQSLRAVTVRDTA